MKKKAQKTISERKPPVEIPHKLTAYVTESNYDIKRAVMMGLISFIGTVFFIIIFSRLLPHVKTISLPSFPTHSPSKPQMCVAQLFLQGGVQEVDPLMIKSIIDTKNDEWILIDYRSPAEYQAAHIKGAINIPLYTDYQKYSESRTSLKQWYQSYGKAKKWGKKVLVYGYWGKSQLSQDVHSYLQGKAERFYSLSIGFTEFKNDFYQWAPGGEMNENSVASYIVGSLVAPSSVNDGVPANPTTK